MNYPPPNELENSPRSETSIVVKTRIVRRTTSLYTSVKRMKSTKKSRQVVNRKSMKSQRAGNAENGPIVSAIRSSHHGAKATLLKPIGYQLAAESNLQNMGATLTARAQRQAKKTSGRASVVQSATDEPTTAVKQGTKRLKIVSPRIMKTRPEIGESSRIATSEESLTAPTQTIVRFRNKQSAKPTFGRCRKSCIKSDNKTKPRKTSKLKAKS